MEAGREIIAFRRTRGGTIEVDQWAHLQTPPIVDRELQAFHAGRACLTLSEVEYLQACDLKLNDVTRQALRASRGLDFAYTDWVY